jgi:FkbM family methyltransferase
MTEYKSNKIKTAWEIIQRVNNWPTVFGMRLQRQRAGLRLVSFRDGLNIVCRGGTRDWDVVHELLFAGGYHRAMVFLKGLPGKPAVLDLGGNIGLFSLLAASNHPAAEIYAYEPGPPNSRLFEINRLANAALGERIHLRREAVAGTTRTAEWFFDDLNPGGSGLFAAAGGGKFTVQIRAFAEVMDTLPERVGLVKIDIEGAEFELLAATPPAAWARIDAISLELHDDPGGKMSQPDFLKRMATYGFKIEEETVCSFFLHR